MNKWLRKVSGLRVGRKGQTTAEYAIIVALIAVSSIAVILIFGDQIRALFSGEARRLATDGAVEVNTPADDAEGAEGGSLTGW